MTTKIITTIGIIVAILTGIVLLRLSSSTEEMAIGAVVPCKDDATKTIIRRLETCSLIKAEQMSFKGQEIAKTLSKGKFTQNNIEIEIVDFRTIEKGVEVYARAWKGNQQLGFDDGTVDIERFWFVNPPIKVPDSTGSIVRIYNEGTPKETTRRFREDPEEALKIKLFRRVNEFGKSNNKIIAGKRGNSVGTIDASHDAQFNRDVTDPEETWADLINSDGLQIRQDNLVIQISAGQTTDKFERWSRSGFTFDTSGIGSDTVDTAKLVLYAQGSAERTGLGDANLNVTDFNPADDSSYVVDDGDIANWGSVDWSDDKLLSSWVETDNTGNEFILNSSGIASINGSGNTVLGFRIEWDIDVPGSGDSAFTGTWTSSGLTDVRIYFEDEDTNDPELVVTHSAAAGYGDIYIID